MAISGTGTQADPYIPSTITELYTILDTCNADTSAADMSYYIKLTADLDCANDPDYIGYMDHGIYIGSKIASLYTDTNKKIIGLTVKGTYFIKTDADADRIRTPYAISNVEFKNCFFKATTTNAYCLDLFATFYEFDNNALYNVKLSIYVYRLDESILIHGNDRIGYGLGKASVHLEKCSFYFCLKDTENGRVADCCNLNHCNIIVDGSSITGAKIAATGDINNSASFCIFGSAMLSNAAITYTSFIFKGVNLTGNGSQGYYTLMSNCSYSYLACVDCTFSANSMSGSATAYVYNLSHCIMASNDYTNIGHSDTLNVMNYISISDLQNNQTLLDLGFLP